MGRLRLSREAERDGERFAKEVRFACGRVNGHFSSRQTKFPYLGGDQGYVRR